MIKLQTKDTEM